MMNQENTTAQAQAVEKISCSTKEQIEKVIEINGVFTAILDPNCVSGYGNIQVAYPHVTVWKTSQGFEVLLDTYNEWDEYYAYFGESRYICSPGKWVDDEGYHYLSFPGGFNNKAKAYVERLLNTLSAE